MKKLIDFILVALGLRQKPKAPKSLAERIREQTRQKILEDNCRVICVAAKTEEVGAEGSWIDTTSHERGRIMDLEEYESKAREWREKGTTTVIGIPASFVSLQNALGKSLLSKNCN